MFLQNLSRGYLVEKDPNAPLFYREEGNKKFQQKDYMGATVLYSKVRHRISAGGATNDSAMHSSSGHRTLLLTCVASGSLVYNL